MIINTMIVSTMIINIIITGTVTAVKLQQAQLAGTIFCSWGWMLGGAVLLCIPVYKRKELQI